MECLHEEGRPHLRGSPWRRRRPGLGTEGEGDSAARKKTRAREIATAVADVKCKQQVDYVTVWQSVETTYQNKIIKDQQAGARRRSADVAERSAEGGPGAPLS